MFPPIGGVPRVSTPGMPPAVPNRNRVGGDYFCACVTSLRPSASMEPTSLLRGATGVPERAARYLPRRISSTIRKGYFEFYRSVSAIERQKPLIREFTDRDEFMLVVLDACRYDEFERIYDNYLDGKLQRAWASGRWTAEYVERTWTGTHELTYVNSAPVISNRYFEQRESTYRPTEHLSNLVDVWQTHWDPQLETVPAEAVTAVALDQARDGPTRVVAHYMQPHVPYVGTARLNHTTSTEQLAGQEVDPDTVLEHENRSTYMLLDMLEKGQISEEELHSAYRDNLDYVFRSVVELVRRVECPVVITADHGEHLGENGKYLHEEDSTLIRQVPWFTVSEEEIGTQAGHPFEYDGRVEPATDGSTEITDRLESLGYV